MFRLAIHMSAIFANFGPKMTNSNVGLGDQLEDDDDGCWRSEFCGSAKVLRPVKT